MKRECHACGVTVTKLNHRGSNKRNYRHKCPHGKWCATGNPRMGISANHNVSCEECLSKRMDLSTSTDNSGSAETGGEKPHGELAEGSHPLLDFNEFDYEDCAACAFVETDPCPYHIGFANGAKWGVANFRRTSQNRTVSTGVEGAHEGTATDKSEPEKLNNAQKVEGK